MSVLTLFKIEPEFGDGDDDEPQVMECECGNTLMQISSDFTLAYCPLCGTTWEPEYD
jgi:hypothetical protein